MATLDLFANATPAPPSREHVVPGAWVLRRFALPYEDALLSAITDISRIAPFRHMVTPGGFRMSVAMTNAGTLGWVTDRSGYRYDTRDPESGKPWPALPPAFLELASDAAASAGFDAFVPDACLVNRYAPGAKMSLHQDKNERDMTAPIVSASLGLPAVFQFGGEARSEKPLRISLDHGDVVVWGAEARLRYHGILPLKEGTHTRCGSYRYNLTFRRAG